MSANHDVLVGNPYIYYESSFAPDYRIELLANDDVLHSITGTQTASPNPKSALLDETAIR